MTIACPRCQAQNADGARFCRACGTVLADAAPPPVDTSAAGVACDDCGHVNAPGTRYCAKCGYSLVGTVIVSKRDSTYGGLQGLTTAPTPADPAPPATQAAPPAAPAPAPTPAPQPSWMAPPPARGTRVHEDTDTFDPLSAPTQVMHNGADGHGGAPTAPAAEPFSGAAPPSSRTGLYVVGGLLALAVVAGAGWWLMKPGAAPSSPTSATAPAAPAPTEPAAQPPAPAAPAPTTAVAEPPPSASVPPPVAAPEPAPVTTPAAAAAPPVQAPAPVQATAPTAAPPAAVATSDRDAARKATREKAARDREAKARAATEAREQDLARQRAAQDASRSAPPPAAPVAVAPPAAPAPLPTVKEMCGGRNLISQGLCEQRECRKAEHAGEAFCKQLKEAEERRLYQ